MSAPSKGVKYLDGLDFRELGFLQEANRQFFHPLGLALEWSPGWTKEDFAAHMVEQGYQYGDDAMDNAWAAVCALGLDKPFLGPRVWDYREDPEGVAFGPDMIDGAKVDHVAAEFEKHKRARVDLLGSVIQRIGDESLDDIDPRTDSVG